MIAVVFGVNATVIRNLIRKNYGTQKKGIKHNLDSMCLFIHLFIFYLGAFIKVGYIENHKIIFEPFGTTCEPHRGFKSNLISFYSYRADLLYPLAGLYSQWRKKKKTQLFDDSIVLFFDNMP